MPWRGRLEPGEDVIAKAGRELAVFGGSASLVEALRAATTSTTLRLLTIIAGLCRPRCLDRDDGGRDRHP